MKSLLKKILPQPLVDKLVDIKQRADKRFITVFAANRYFASLYYFLFSGQFRREHLSVLRGRLAYEKSLKELGNSHPLLRRNTHRLEKGLIMQPRKPVFAEAYIDETVGIFVSCAHQETFCRKELKWSHDVLTEYFTNVSHTQVIADAYQRFLSVPQMVLGQQSEQDNQQNSSIPYASESRQTTTITPDELAILFKQRRSVRWFDKQTVNDETIKKAIEMAAQAPSACNRQPFSFYTTVEPSKAAEISAIPMGTKGFSDNIPALIVVVGDLSAYPKERDRHVIYIDGALATMQLMLAFESMGLSTCPINWPDIEQYEQQLAKRLELAPYQRPIMMLAIGYAKDDGGIPYSQKKTAKQLLKLIP